ncbi:F-actin-capping protein subunit beta [Geodia barretti]|uniref:F-actin-capping protein subunit beta n=1 Tax=Geodia barretti TaxID=519541 RepID=A0AA35WAS1_GEOBA|nr:F-actin-capping protein subunit beta [Geodia barretti]
MVKDMENKMRQTLNEIYFRKIKDVLNHLRSAGDLKLANKQWQLAAELK